MRRFDKNNNIRKANLLSEQRYLKSKGLIIEDTYIDNEGNLQGLETPKLDDVKVSVIDVAKLNDDIDNFIKSKVVNSDGDLINQSSNFRIRETVLSLLKLPKNDKLGGSFAILDMELNGKYEKNGSFVLPVYEDSYDENGKQKGFGVAPETDITISVDNLSKNVIGEKTLKEFMGDRYKYNSRIENNMYNIANILGVSM